MLTNFIRITFRNFNKQKSFVAINVVGLALSLACCIVAYINYKYSRDFDKIHEKRDNIYKIHTFKNVQGNPLEFGITPMPLANAIKEDIPEINIASRYIGSEIILKHNENIFNEWIGFIDPAFIEMFSIKTTRGTIKSIHEKGNILITEETAKKYFKDKNPLGEIMHIYVDDREYNFIVSAVVEDMPNNNSFIFDGLLNFENYKTIRNIKSNDWKMFAAGTFIHVDKGFNTKAFSNQLNQYIPIQNDARNDWKASHFELVHLPDLGSRVRDIRSNWLNANIHPAAVSGPPTMALLILLIACFNFTNTSLASSSSRVKEIGIRKVIGGNRRQLIFQFFGENLVICFMAIVLSLVIATYLVPSYSALWQGMNLELDFTGNINLYIFLFGLLIACGIIAGAYPSIYISKFEPVKILKGNFTIRGGNSLFAKVLLAAQFALTIISLLASIVFIQNANYQKNKDMGFTREGIIFTELHSKDAYDKYRNELLKHKNIHKVAASGNHIGRWTYGRTMKWKEKEIEADMMDFSPEYFDLMEVELLSGRFFKKELKASDRENSIIINKTLADQFGWDNPIGKRVAIDDSTRLNVVGMIRSFHDEGFFNPLEPLGIRYVDDEGIRFLVASVDNQKLLESYEDMQAAWLNIFPSKPFEGYYEDRQVAQSLTVNNNLYIIFAFMGIISVILSSIGLYTMVSLNVIRKTKEIGIRKVLGANLWGIVKVINKPYVILILLAAIAGTYGGYYLVLNLISSIFFYFQPISLTAIVLPIIFLLILGASISSGRILMTALQNPALSLRDE
ncbi:MAG TPA: FtsX-like permease family protein [Cyclobacteriaceae bacterium]